ncbi:MAG: leucine-rich repeat domain-containing protein [Firmicutes bacterium]|nr:leucine-rich repeat domain-containing protein [Bacillota bacterium]
MKKILLGTGVLVSILSLTFGILHFAGIFANPQQSDQIHFTTADDFTWTTSGGVATITGLTPAVLAMTNPIHVVIPNYINLVPVQIIAPSAFLNIGIVGLTIPDNGSFQIETNAFRNNNLKTLTIPTSVNSIGNTAFAHNNLISVTLAHISQTIIGTPFLGNPNVTIFTGRSERPGSWSLMWNRIAVGPFVYAPVVWEGEYEPTITFNITGGNATVIATDINDTESVLSNNSKIDWATTSVRISVTHPFYIDNITINGKNISGTSGRLDYNAAAWTVTGTTVLELTLIGHDLVIEIELGGSLQPSVLDTPQDLNVTNNILTWTQVDNAVSYIIIINEQEFTSTATSFNLASVNELIETIDTLSIRIIAVGDGITFTDSKPSDVISVNLNKDDDNNNRLWWLLSLFGATLLGLFILIIVDRKRNKNQD